MSASRLVEIDVCRPEYADKLSSQGQFSLTRPRRAAPISQGALFALIVALSPPAIAAPDVSTTGNASPAIAPAPTVNLPGVQLLLGGTIGGIGQIGALNVSGGGNLTVGEIDTGFGGLGDGSALVTGAGSIVTIVKGALPVGGLDAGSWGTGTITVDNGGVITCTAAVCPNIRIGSGAGSTGRLTIDGTGSSITGLSQVTVAGANAGPGFGTPGGTTHGTLEVKNGGVLATTGFSVVSPGGSGTLANGLEQTMAIVTIDGAGSIWSVTQDPVSLNQAAINIAATPNATATVIVTNGAHLDLAGTQSYMGVGDGGSATLTIASGGQVSTGNMAIGNQATGVGTVTVGNGVGQSMLTATNSMGVGNSSTGLSQLTVNTGGLVNVTGPGGLGIANSPGSQGKVLVDGGQLNVNGTNAFFGVGNGGTASLTIQNGGQVNAVNLGIGNNSAGSGTVVVGNGVGASTLTATNSIGVGNNSTALSTLTINTGGTVSITGNGGGLSIGGVPGAHGAVTVDGGQFALLGTTNVGVSVGISGTGSLTIKNGGTFTTSGLNGLGIAGAVGGSGTVLVDAGTLTVQGTNAFFGVGNGGAASLTIQNGGQVNAVNLGIGNNSAGSGTVVVGNGVGASTLTATNSIGVGNNSAALSTLTINAGGTVSITGNGGGLSIGGVPGAHGAVTVDGGQFALLGTTNVGVGVGNGGTGSLTIKNGGTFTTSGLNGLGIAGQVGSSGTVLVDAGILTVQGTNAFFGVGNGGAASLTIQNGGQVSANSLGIANNVTGVGTVTVGVGSTLSLGTGGLGVGNRGSGTMTVENGGTVTCSAACGFSSVGNAAGSTGTLTISGAGSSVTGFAQFNVGQANVSPGFGIPSGTTHATMVIEGGATLATRGFSAIGSGPSGSLATGGEHAIANVTIDGPGSNWTVASNTLSNTQAQINLAFGAGATSTVNLTNGGKIVINGSTPLVAANTAGMTLSGGSTVTGGTSTLNIDGNGSAVVINGDTGFLNVGRNASTATLNLTNGGQIYGGGANGLLNLNVARLGSTATVNVNGAGSSITLSGVGGVNSGSDGLGAFMNLGRDAGSVGTFNVTNGGALVIRDGGQTATGGNTVGMILGRDVGSSGTMLVSGAGSSVTVEQTGTGTLNPQVTVGRAGTGSMTITNGATFAVSGNGTTERIFVVGAAVGGATPGGVGTLTVSNGANLSASWFAIGNNSSGGTNGGVGTATIDNATVSITGVTVTGNTITGGGVRVGRGPGSTGILNLVNGAQITINTTASTPEIFLGGTGVAPGGNGTLNMSGASNISFTGTGATPRVVIGHSGTGLMTMIQGSTLNLSADGSVIVGATATGNGRLEMTGNSSIQAGNFFGIAHDGTTSTGGIGTVVLDNSSITATSIKIGAGGCLAGNGTLHGMVVMDGATSIGGCNTQLISPTQAGVAGKTQVGIDGLLNPGRSPGRIVIDGGFDFISGTIILEVQSDGLGGFLHDEIVFSGGSALDLTGMDIVFSFLGVTDPEAFEASGDWNLNTFFKTNSSPGLGVGGDMDISTLGVPLVTLFANSSYDAEAASYVIDDFAFNPVTGVTELVTTPIGAVPEPGTGWLLLLGALLLWHVARMRRPFARARRA